MGESGHNYFFAMPEMPWKKERSMYQMSVVQIPGEWRNRQFPIEAPNGCRLHSFVYAAPERIVCIWERDAVLTAYSVAEDEAVEWGASARVGAETV